MTKSGTSFDATTAMMTDTTNLPWNLRSTELIVHPSAGTAYLASLNIPGHFCKPSSFLVWSSLARRLGKPVQLSTRKIKRLTLISVEQCRQEIKSCP
ncbi:hypothetical protein ElyMa_004978000 [Elysia marginata]|uniref:Uncharacterized protein n=1 Tax=Elysia marginata TaxID=1093978 RepID=A0AAV4J7K8_9GAST|nr:hypothetical protein ElyMa_004978000 [Elysia marginata]